MVKERHSIKVESVVTLPDKNLHAHSILEVAFLSR